MDSIPLIYRRLSSEELTLRGEISKLKAELELVTTRLYTTDEECVNLREELRAKVNGA